MKFVDLFAGIGGFHRALADEFGHAECVFACDIDPDCRAVYEKNFGISPAGDIRPLTEGSVVSIPEHDVLCAGFPCQPFSKSGHQLGINETRGTLFYNILRVLEARRPQYILLENVRNLAGPRHRHTWATIVKNLRDLGYRVSDKPLIFSPHLLPPPMGGRPQIRDRVFILGEYVGEGSPDVELEEPIAPYRPEAGWDPQQWSIEEYLSDDLEGADDIVRLRPVEIEWLNTWNDLLQSLPPDRLPGFPMWADAFVEEPPSDDDTPLWKRDFLQKNSEFYTRHRSVIDAWFARHPEFAEFPLSRRKFEWQAQDAPRDIWQLVIHLRPSGIRVKRGTYLPALVAITQTSIIGWRRRRITPREAARLQGFPDSFELHPEATKAYQQLGNAVNVGVVRHLARRLIAGSSQLNRSSETMTAIEVA